MDDIVQYFVVNQDLGMRPGKIAAQVAHGATISAVNLSEGINVSIPAMVDFMHWYSYDMRKIVLKAPEDTLRDLLKAGAKPVIDAGHTQVDPGSLTVVFFDPQPKSKLEHLVGGLKLL